MQMQKFPKITLAAARVNAGLSQQEAAKALGVSVATLQNYESGKTVPQWGTVQKIEAVYNFPADFIFCRETRFKRTFGFLTVLLYHPTHPMLRTTRGLTSKFLQKGGETDDHPDHRRCKRNRRPCTRNTRAAD